MLSIIDKILQSPNNRLNNVINTNKFISAFGQPINPVFIKYFEKNEYFTPLDLCKQIIVLFLTKKSIQWYDIVNNISKYIKLSPYFDIVLEYIGVFDSMYVSQEDQEYISQCEGLYFTINNASFRNILIAICDYPVFFEIYDSLSSSRHISNLAEYSTLNSETFHKVMTLVCYYPESLPYRASFRKVISVVKKHYIFYTILTSCPLNDIDNVINKNKFFDIFGQLSHQYLVEYLESNESFTPRDLCKQIIDYFLIENSIQWCDVVNNINKYIKISPYFAIALEYIGILELPYVSDEEREYVSQETGIDFTINGTSFHKIMTIICDYPAFFTTTETCPLNGIDNIINTNKFIDVFGQPTIPYIVKYLEKNDYFTPSKLCYKIIEWFFTEYSIRTDETDEYDDSIKYNIYLSYFAIALDYTGTFSHQYINNNTNIFHQNGYYFTTNGNSLRNVLITICDHDEHFKFD